MTAREQQLRRQLGIPEDAETILFLGETSHWDPNWLLTSEEYYRLRIRRILDGVLRQLQQEPRRVFSVECLYFFKHFWEREGKQKQHLLRQLVNEGRIRFTGSGITTPDTVLPDSEPILRDYLLGQQWLRQRGMTQEPHLAYLPDDFGHSPALPAMLRAMGYRMAAITRIDGMYFEGTDFRLSSSFPLAGSSAELLLKKRALDFVWRAPDGSEVLTHWNAFTYYQGDMLASVGVIRWMGVTFGLPWRTGRHVARRIKQFVRQLRPVSRTPYLFCPIGCDFNGPIPDLVALLDRFNSTRYGDTGIWAVNAGMDDYLGLVGCHRDRLPTLTLDPNPYWMGFYATRPEIKRVCNEVSRRLVLTEKLAVLSGCADNGAGPGETSAAASPQQAGVLRRARAAWDLIVVTNHHDYITGTSPTRVWRKEQQGWLQQAEALSISALERIRASLPDTPGGALPPTPAWRHKDGRLEVSSSHYQLTLDEAAGGCLVSYRPAGGGPELLRGPANDLVVFQDRGGLWRMGHEFRGGKFVQKQRASELPARIQARVEDGFLEVRVDSELEGRRLIRWLWLRDDSPIIRMRLVGSAARQRTITCRFPTIIDGEELAMDVPGGVLNRPLQKLYEPTFWAANNFVHLTAPGPGPGLAAFLGGPACVACDSHGTMDWVALRNAPRELAWGFVPIPAHPASGEDNAEHSFDYAVWFTLEGQHRQNRLLETSRQVLQDSWLEPGRPDHGRLADSLLWVKGEAVISAVKPADLGDGIIVRLETAAPRGTEIELHLANGEPRTAMLCDALERDHQELAVDQGSVRVPLQGSITSVRLIF